MPAPFVLGELLVPSVVNDNDLVKNLTTKLKNAQIFFNGYARRVRLPYSSTWNSTSPIDKEINFFELIMFIREDKNNDFPNLSREFGIFVESWFNLRRLKNQKKSDEPIFTKEETEVLSDLKKMFRLMIELKTNVDRKTNFDAGLNIVEVLKKDIVGKYKPNKDKYPHLSDFLNFIFKDSEPFVDNYVGLVKELRERSGELKGKVDELTNLQKNVNEKNKCVQSGLQTELDKERSWIDKLISGDIKKVDSIWKKTIYDSKFKTLLESYEYSHYALNLHFLFSSKRDKIQIAFVQFLRDLREGLKGV